MSVLVVGHLESVLGDALKILFERGHQTLHVSNADKALALMRKGCSSEMILMDVAEDIPAFLKSMAAERFSCPVIACSLEAIDRDKVKAALDAGAKEFIPFPPDAHLIADIFDAFYQAKQSFLFKDPAMTEVVGMADKISQSDASVLITGESGTGKEVMARYLHQKSARAKKGFWSVNCAAIPENLLESELFGHEKGAFTGAVARRIGKFEEANGGTLLLDEISEMHPRLQAKLLRAIQEKEIDRIGGGKPIPVNFRLLTTSNRDMQKAIAEGDFREDLYFRISVIHLQLPPLRDRPDDLALLANHFMTHYSDVNGIDPKPKLLSETLDFINHYEWPGNVRELENVMHRAVLLASSDEIHPQHLGLSLEGQGVSNTNSPHALEGLKANSSEVAPLVGQTLASVERDLILSTLESCNQDSMRAAKLLGLTLKALRFKLKEYEKNLSTKNAPGLA
ncbi:MAG: sigma-54 dependent transcriptional regulator [Holosporaceae bacterium]